MTRELTIRSRSVSGAGLLATLLLLAFLASIAFVDDVGILRRKLFISRGLLLLTTAAVLARQAFAGRLVAPRPALLAATLLPGLVATGWIVLGGTGSRALAQEEIFRLLLFPVAAWTAATVLDRAGPRRAFAAILAVGTLWVGVEAMLQNLSGLLDLSVERQPRSFATFGNPVLLGAFFVMALPFCVMGALFGRGHDRWLHALAVGFGLPALLATDTRSAWLGFAVSLLVGTLLVVSKLRHRLTVLAGAGVLVLLLLVVEHEALSRTTAHPLIWRDSLTMLADHPHGIGPGQFSILFPPYASDELLEHYPRAEKIVNAVHSEPLQILVELGWLGALAALVPLVLLMLTLRRLAVAIPATHEERPAFIATTAAIAGVLAQSCASPDLRFTVSTMLFGVVLGRLVCLAPSRGLSIPRGSVAALAVAMLVAALAVTTTWSGLRLGRLVQPASAGRVGPTPEQRALVDDIRARVADDPDDWTLHFRLGTALGDLREFGQAAAAFRRVLELHPRNAPAVRNLGVCSSIIGEDATALDLLARALATNPRDSEARYLRALSAYRSQELAVALNEVETLLDGDPDHARGLALRELLRE